MTSIAAHSGGLAAADADVRLRARLRGAGFTLIMCSEAGEIERDSAAAFGDPLTEMLQRSTLLQRLIKVNAPQWLEDQEQVLAIEPVPGLWLAPMPRGNRPRMTARSRRPRPQGGLAVILLFTDAIFGEGGRRGSHCSEGLAALCQSAQMDYETAARLIAKLPPAHEGDAGRLLSLARYVYEDHLRAIANEHAIESTGQQLAESYEEISLLYTIIQSMTVVEQPERFVTIACEELLDTLPYGWIGAQLCANRNKLKQLAGRFFMAGAWPAVVGGKGHGAANGAQGINAAGAGAGIVNRHAMAHGGATGRSLPNPLMLQLLHTVQPDAPIVLEPGSNPAHAQYRSLGNTTLVHPVTSDGEVIGILAAGDKQGPDTTASNVDMKLLGAIASHMAIFLENAALYDDLNAMFLGTLEALTASIDAKDRYTCGHSQRVAHLTQQLARVIGLDENVVRRMHIAGLVHDVGKIGVPEGLLLKPGKLTDEEFAWIKRHPEIGYRILKDIPQLQDILPGVLYHHERWDGRGYPKGLKGEEIPQVARLIGLADSFDAMSSTRTYRSGMDRKQVLKEIERCSGTQFDPELVPIFIELDFREYDRMMIEHRAGGAMPGISSAA